MASPALPRVRIQREDFDQAREIAALASGKSDVGAVVTFTGLCRDENGMLEALELEHYPGMAETQITRIAETACERWPLSGVSIVHRYGLIKPGENIVLVATASAHRHAAFEAASFIMDFLKSDAPFWKKEHRKDGRSGNWVEAKISDAEAQEKWR
jgi:molybdopterin synthase catalytic subunit